MEGRADTVEAAVKELSSCLKGRDASQIENIWQVLYRGGFYRGRPALNSAISGIDETLWDIKGKATGLPVHNLLGGSVRDRMLVYQWKGGNRPRAAREKQQADMKAVKMNGGMDRILNVDGPDILFIGSYDLSQSLGVPRDRSRILP